MTSKNLQTALKIFQKSGGVLTMSEALKLGIHRRELYQLHENGQLEQLSRGLYRLKKMPEPASPDFLPIAKKISKGVICLISALAFHELTTQIPHFVYVALPQNKPKPSIDYPPTRYFWYSEKSLKTGIKKHRIDGCIVSIFDAEKTLVDCIKFRNKIGMDIVLEALHMYWPSRKKNINKLLAYAKMFKMDRILKPILETIASGYSE